ncbi:hypothetical protein [Streptomyces sp. SCL15-4]|uniref:hypothetical protein n=1 Tax=Streptomyces sp. SCL15-4 TaxID=2967221 RepID=UPI00296650F6|nr:hypothetical protein [Streptomyces sp. SCL15-4]
MFRGTAVRSLLAVLGVVLLALQLRTGTGVFAPAHAFGQTLTEAQTGTAPSTQPARAGADTIRAPGSPDLPVGVPHARDRHRGPAAGWPDESALISGRAATASPPARAHGPLHPVPGALRPHTPAALQVFRC